LAAEGWQHGSAWCPGRRRHRRLGQRLNQGRARKDKAGTLAHTLARALGALWTLVVEAGVEPTNHRAERALRCAVRWRKLRQGTDNAMGDRGVERVLAVRQTCRVRGRPTFPMLGEAVTCAFNGPPPNVSWIEWIQPLNPYKKLLPPLDIGSHLNAGTQRRGRYHP
jgi:hypothetical protein